MGVISALLKMYIPQKISGDVVEGPYDVDLDKYRRVWYNPIVDTEWYVQGYPNPVTGMTFPELITKGNKVYCYNLG